MPLLNKQPFSRNKPPPDLEADEEIFFCEPTKEIFRDYDKFFERMILCNSLLWSCEMTGKSGLTYLEAAESERSARRSLSSVQKELKRALLLLCSMTRKTNFNELCVDIFTFIRNGFSKEKLCKSKEARNGLTARLRLYVSRVAWILRVLSMDMLMGKKTAPSYCPNLTLKIGLERRTSQTSRLKVEGVPVERVLYQVWHVASSRLLTVRMDELRRDKASFSKERLRVLLKHSTRVEEGGFLVVRAPAARSLGLDGLQWQSVFVGPTPVFFANKPLASKVKPSDKVKVVPEKTRVKSEVTKDAKTEMAFDEKDDEPLSSVQLEIRQRWEAERRLLAERRVQERDRRRHSKKMVAEWLKDWSKPRDDLLCEDHKELPVMVPVHTRIPSPLFGGCLQLLEFVNSFGPLLQLTDTFPLGLTLPILERSLIDTEVAGSLSDLLQVLLRAVFELQKEEDEESGGRSSTAAASGADQLDPLTVTEVLRRHLVARDIVDDSRWRYHQRGGYTETDNPTVQFRLDHPDIMQKLSVETVYDLSPGERLAILECLVGEILTTVTARDVIDEAENKLKEARAQLRALRLNILAYQRGVAAEKVTERREDRQRQQLEQAKAAAEPTGDEPTDEPTEPATDEPEPTEAERQRRRLDEQRQLAEFARREARLLEQMGELSRQFCVAPLGRDRAYRRYWLCRALPGLFVEHDDAQVGGCLSAPTPHNAQLAVAEPTAELRRMLTEQLLQRAGLAEPTEAAAAAEHAGRGDKENKPAAPPPAKTYCKRPAALAEQNARDERPPAPAELEVKGQLDELVCGEKELESVLRSVPLAGAAPADRRLLVCTAEGDECPVHSDILPRTNWAFCPDLHHLDSLLSALNERGVREFDLKAALLQAGDTIRRSVEKCPHSDLTQGEERRARREPTSSGNDVNYNFPAGTPVAKIQELLLRDMILECEEKIRFGCLGTVQVLDLASWRQALVDQSYDKQCFKLMWGADGACSADNSEDVSGASTPSSDGAEPPPPSAAELAHQLQRGRLVRSVASAILQLAQGIDRRYLQKPLGESDTLHQWEVSLMSSTSLSQLFVHFGQLESSVLWSRSALNARCKICRKKSDPNKMLLCDGCDKGFHMFCLMPKMKSIPKGDWFCSTCRPKDKPKSPKKKRRAFILEDDEAELATSDDELDEESVAPPPAKRSSKGGKRSAGGSSFKRSTPTARRTVEVSPPAAKSSAKKRKGGSDQQLDCALLSDLLSDVRQHPCSQMFLRPVKVKEAPGYYQIVHEPMDFGTMQKKLNTTVYSSNAEFVADAALVFSNCAMYNDNKSDIYRNCEKLRRFFEKRSRELGLGVSKRARRS